MIDLNLTLNEVNGVLTALGNMPYTQVEALITKIRDQAIPQAQNLPQDVEPVAAPE